VSSPAKTRIIVGITGASGSIYGVRLLERLRGIGVETHLIISLAARQVIPLEIGLTPEAVESLADYSYRPEAIGAAVASGSFRTAGMVITPCSMRTMSEIASGVTSSLLSLAADVTLKERRRLVLAIRETPLHLGHLRSLTALAEMGAIIAPPVPAMYAMPKTIDDLVSQSVGRILDLLELEDQSIFRWGESDDQRG
jgi:flavin prenyltransferase